MSYKKNNKRNTHYANDKTEQDIEFKFLRAPKNSDKQAAQLLALDNHISWLKNRVKRDYGDISILVTQGNMPEIVHPLPVGTPLHEPQTPAHRTRAAAREEEPVAVMTQQAYDEISKENRDKLTKREENQSKALGLILTTIDGAFQTYINGNREATNAYDRNDIKTIMKHLNIWYKKTLGSSSTNVRAVSEADIAKAKEIFEALKQFNDQSVQAFKNIFDANLKIYLETTGEEMTDKRKAFIFISKLYPPKFDKWVTKKKREDSEFRITEEENPNTVQPANIGCPRTLEMAYNLALIEEREIYTTERQEQIKARREEEKLKDGEETNSSNPSLSSYAKRKDSGKINHNTNKKLKFGYPPGTKPSAIGWQPCFHWSHKKGDDLDHLYSDCPFNQLTENEKKASYHAERARERNPPPPPTPPQPHVSFAPTTSYSYAPPAQQYSHHSQSSHSSALSQLSREDLERAYLQLASSKKYSNMFAYNYLSEIENPYALLLDSGGTDHDMSNPAFKFNVRENPDANMPITTIMGTYFSKEICTCPFLGRAGSNNNGNLNIISLGKLHDTPNVDIKSNEKISKVDVTFILLNLTITFQFGKSRILIGDGKALADAIDDYKVLCDKKGINIFDAMDCAITIDQLRESNIICDTLINISKLEEGLNVMQISTLPTVQLPVSAKIEASEKDTVQVPVSIPYSDEGVNIAPITVSSIDQSMKPDQGVPLDTKQSNNFEAGMHSNERIDKKGIFPHKFIFKDIVIGGADVQKTAAAEIPVTKSLFSVCETVGPPYNDAAEPPHTTVEKSFCTSELHPKFLTKALKKEKFKILKNKLLAYRIN